MSYRFWMSFVALFFVAVLGACRGIAPVYNVEKTPIVASKPNADLNDVAKAIERAGVGLGWQMRAVRPGMTVGTLALRGHTAAVDIDYDTKTYSIRYKGSTNLDYDGNNIHSNYNGWIQNLDKAIKAQLTVL